MGGRRDRDYGRVHPRCATDANLDKKDMYRTNYEATKLAIQRAKLPPPPPELARQLRDGGVVLNFKP